MKILVTGHRGYIGRKLFSQLNKLCNGVDVLHGIDLKDGRDIMHHLPDRDYDYIFHLAAFPRVQQSVEEPSDTFRNNAYATSILLEWAKNHNVKRVIFSSSAATKGDGQGPTSPYGLQKLISEQECKLYSEIYGLDTVCLRYYNVFSEDQEYGGSYSTVICAWKEMIRKNLPLRIDGDGTQSRDFIHVGDIVRANIFAMEFKERFNGASLDVGTGIAISLNELRDLVKEGNDISFERAPERKGDVKNSIADTSGLKKLGWSSIIDPREAILNCFKNTKGV